MTWAPTWAISILVVLGLTAATPKGTPSEYSWMFNCSDAVPYAHNVILEPIIGTNKLAAAFQAGSTEGLPGLYNAMRLMHVLLVLVVLAMLLGWFRGCLGCLGCLVDLDCLGYLGCLGCTMQCN